MDYLARRISYPLEREYEAWIIHQIEHYFRGLGVPVSIFAVSPTDEKTWPADEVVDVNGKIVGLQFKKPQLTIPCAPNDFTRLHWDFSPQQLQRVVVHAEIFFCLPTFMNRDVRDEALRQCLFWRPPDATDHRAWYENTNPQVKTQHVRICDAPRWGLFVEQFIRCQIGRKLERMRFSSYMRSLLLTPTEDREQESTIQMLLLKTEAGNLTSA